jgi:two-component system CheB/CheR fusion protein
LAKTVEGEKAQKLVARLDETLGAMSGMLNTLLDINQIEAGTIQPETIDFPNRHDLLDRLRDEFTYHAQAQRLALRVVPCSLSIRSDPRLLEQMIRNLLSNALKYTKHGKVLLGCRRREGMLSIEIWDTGVGIPAEELEAIFDEYHQLDNAARERSRGLGLGLAIVKRLGDLLGHRVRVRSQPGKGSVFSIEVMLPPVGAAAQLEHHRRDIDDVTVERVRRTGTILVVEDDPEVRELLDLLLKDEGHRVVTAPDGVVALDVAARGTVRPDLILVDYNLPNGLNGIQVTAKLQEKLRRKIPAIILTGDISTGTLRDIARQDCVQLNKPVKVKELTQLIQRLLPIAQSAAPARVAHPAAATGNPGAPVIFVVDDDGHVRDGIRSVLEDDGRTVEDYATCEAFLEAYRPGREGCLLIDAYLPGMNGLELLQRLGDAGHRLPAIMITGNSDVPMAVRAMKAGASDFIEKPVGRERTARQRRARSRIVAGFKQAVRLARDSGSSRRRIDRARAPDHGIGPRRPAEQEYRRGSSHQPTHRRESSRLDHEENRLEIAPSAGQIGTCRYVE